MPKQTGFLNLW